MAARNLQRYIADFEFRLGKLRIWPDKNIIFELTKIADINQKLANHIADILISRIIDPLTSKALKVPLFYLVDSVLKNVGGPYIPLFSSHIVEVFRRVFDELNEQDQARLDYMLSTWEERRVLQRELLVSMRNHIGTRIVCIPLPVPIPHYRGQDTGVGRHSSVLSMPLGLEDRRRGRDESGWRGEYEERRPGGLVGGRVFKQQVRREMTALLEKMYDDMRVVDRLPLEDLQRMNPTLYTQLWQTAEGTVHDRQERELVRAGGRSAERGSRGFLEPEAKKPRLDRGRERDRSRVKAFVGEVPVTVDLTRANKLIRRLRQTMRMKKTDSDGVGCVDAVTARLSSLLVHVHIPPPLPSILSGATLSVAGADDDDISQVQPSKPPEPVKRVSPPFRADELGKNPAAAIRAMYADRRYVSRQDGLRFLTQQELGAHLDTLFVRNRGKQRKDEHRDCRSWYCTIPQWVSDFSALTQFNSKSVSDTGALTGGGGGEGEGEDSDEEMVVPADEQFPRCPVSNEAFLQEWDGEEGDYVYRNAVKILVTMSADPDMFRLSKPVSSVPTVGEEVRYAIVHKHLVLDHWVSSGKVISLKEYVKRLKSEDRGSEASAMAVAAGEDEDEEDVYVTTQQTVHSENEAGDSIVDHRDTDNDMKVEVKDENNDEEIAETITEVKHERSQEDIGETEEKEPIISEDSSQLYTATEMKDENEYVPVGKEPTEPEMMDIVIEETPSTPVEAVEPAESQESMRKEEEKNEEEQQDQQQQQQGEEEEEDEAGDSMRVESDSLKSFKEEEEEKEEEEKEKETERIM
mmetsp:Transcript_22897/g.23123  ORF Transcript_22897/g.23123 Transcript_22897/m.23123 type:complete len:804 (+) Transcript_22897:150-2561(+)